jgi:hypothetical protein
MGVGNMRRPAWTRRVKVGDILANRAHRRVVRQVSYLSDGRLHAVCFAIMHCSWTTRCYTTYMFTDLMLAGYAPTEKSVKLRKKIDRKIARDLEYIHRLDQKLDCCDVKGIA